MSWTKLFDEASQAHYYWNQETDETSWDKPDDYQEEGKEQQPKDKDDEKSKEDDYYKSKEYYDWYYSTYYPHLVQQQQHEGGAASQLLTEKDKAEGTYQDYSAQGFFNTRTGKFQSSTFNEKFAPKEHFDPATRAKRQMDVYFDVDRYTEERGVSRTKDEKKLTKKEVQFYRKRNAERKKQKAIEKYRD